MRYNAIFAFKIFDRKNLWDRFLHIPADVAFFFSSRSELGSPLRETCDTAGVTSGAESATVVMNFARESS
jgi:hypothetical protein